MNDPLHLILELDPLLSGPRGRLVAPGADPVAFTGWLALVAALERALASSVADGRTASPRNGAVL